MSDSKAQTLDDALKQIEELKRKNEELQSKLKMKEAVGSREKVIHNDSFWKTITDKLIQGGGKSDVDYIKSHYSLQ